MLVAVPRVQVLAGLREFPMKIVVRITIAYVLGLIIIGCVGIQSNLEIQRLREMNRQVVHTHKVIESLEKVLSVLKDAETGQRSFILTGKVIYLEPYNTAFLEIPKILNDVTSLTEDNPPKQNSLQQLDKLSFKKLTELKEAIKIRRNAGLEATRKVINVDRRKHLMDKIRALVDQMITYEQKLLDERSRIVNKLNQRSSWWVDLSVLIALGILGVAVGIVYVKSKELLEAQIELERSKRLADIGTLAATVAHELRNPLASIELSAFHIKRTIKDPRVEGDISSIKKCLLESDQIINNILLYSKLKTSNLQAIKINSILKESIDEAKGRFPRQNIAVNVKTDLIKDLTIEADPLQMKEVFNNILNNAFDAFNNNTGIIDIESQVNDSTVTIFIRDNGEGIEKKNLDKVFDPFFTTKTQGTGLGLAVCNLAIKLHQGSIVIESDKAKGTTVIVTLPIGRQKNA